MSDTLPQPFGYIMIDIHGNACEVLGYTAEQLAAAVAEATKRLQIELENVRAEGLLLAKSAVAMERERCAKLCDPTNADRPDDWTEYAKIQAECAARIRAG